MVKTCQKCSRPVDTVAKGSITQWVFVCRCSLDDGPGNATVHIEICDQCGKSKTENREGSLTQWILRSDTCKCEKENLQSLKRSKKAESEQKQEESLEALKLSVDEFPTDRYKPVRQLGKGAYGEVYLSKDKLLKKWVAIKMMHSISADTLIQFQNEARLVSKLNHSNIVQILDFGATNGGYPYMVMEYVDGFSLRKWIDENGTFSISDACHIGLEICEALSYSLDLGILHRDITAANVIISLTHRDNPQVKVIDFGIAKIRQTEQELNKGKDTVAGNPLYMSADQANGLNYDQRSEIYSIGCLFFELISGQVPFQGDTALETISMHAHEKPPMLKDRVAFPVDERLEEIIEKCLAKEPADRYQSTSELQAAIQEFIESQQIFEVEKDDSETSPGLTVRHANLKTVALLLISVGLVLIVGLALQKHFSKQPKFAEKKIELKAQSKGILPEIDKKAGTFIEGVSRAGSPYTFPVDFLMCDDKKIKELENKRIYNLSLWNCPINGSGLRYLKNVPLNTINLSDTPIDIENYKYLSSIKTLEKILLDNTKINTRGLELIGSSERIKILSFNNCRGVDDQAVDLIVSQYPNLKVLELGRTPVTSKGFKQLGKLKNLVDLNLELTTFSDRDIGAIINLPLVRLNLRGNSISQSSVDKLVRLKRLRYLDITGCQKVKTLPKHKNPRLTIYFQ